MEYTFRSRYSIVLIIVVMLPFAFISYNLVEHPDIYSWIAFVIFVAVLLMVARFQYIINGPVLIFRSLGFKIGEIDIDSIIKVERSYLLLSSNAGSLKRLYFTLKKGSRYPFLLLSPKDETRFLDIIKQINPGIGINVVDKKGAFRFWEWDI